MDNLDQLVEERGRAAAARSPPRTLSAELEQAKARFLGKAGRITER
jgi:hypothetical protein